MALGWEWKSLPSGTSTSDILHGARNVHITDEGVNGSVSNEIEVSELQAASSTSDGGGKFSIEGRRRVLSAVNIA